MANTNNQNESYNVLICERASNGTYLSLDDINFVVYDDVTVFKDGRLRSLNILTNVGIYPGC